MDLAWLSTLMGQSYMATSTMDSFKGLGLQTTDCSSRSAHSRVQAWWELDMSTATRPVDGR